VSAAASASSTAQIEAILDRLTTLRVLVLGDVILDEYRLGDVDRVSPEAPVPIVRVRETIRALGGAGNVARGVAALGARATLVGVVGDDAEGEAVRALLAQAGLSTGGLVVAAERPTTHKLRVVARAQQMLRLDREEQVAFDAATRDALRERIAECLPVVDVVVLQDYDKGVFVDGLARFVLEAARAHRLPVMVDPKRDLGRFRGASLLKPNVDEALANVAGGVDDFAARRALLEKLAHVLGGAEVVLTRGRAGVSALDASGRAFDVPTTPREVYDVQGAGDTAIAALALCRAAGASLVDACIVANAAAGLAVAKSGTAVVSATELRPAIAAARAAFEGAS